MYKRLGNLYLYAFPNYCHERNFFMKIKNAIAFIITIIYISMFAWTNAEAQTITALSANTLTRSGRLKITGSGFGTTPGTVLIDGVSAPVSSWSVLRYGLC